MNQRHSTSWEKVEDWYTSCVGEKGHYYHQSLIIPGALKLLKPSLEGVSSVLDLGCGQGVFARMLPPQCIYYGIDASASLIAEAKKLTKRPQTQFFVSDVTKELPFEKKDFDCALFMLSLQNMEDQAKALLLARSRLKTGGKLLLILNPPCFRIPRQTSWEVDDAQKLQYRRINRYLSPLKIPIQMNPGKGTRSAETYSFHHSLSDYFHFLAAASFATQQLEEWCSDKKSEGSKARMEDRARKEIPLFLALLARAELSSPKIV
jgi:SAM-dependent methyltransferase